MSANVPSLLLLLLTEDTLQSSLKRSETLTPWLMAFSPAYSNRAELGFRGDEEHRVLLSPYHPVSLFPSWLQGGPSTVSSGSGLWAVMVHQGLHLATNLLNFAGLGEVVKAQSHTGR